MNKLYLSYHFREKNAKFHIFLLLSIMGGISLITIYDRKFRHNRPEEGLPKMITYISPINMVAEDNHLYFAYKSTLYTVLQMWMEPPPDVPWGYAVLQIWMEPGLNQLFPSHSELH